MIAHSPPCRIWRVPVASVGLVLAGLCPTAFSSPLVAITSPDNEAVITGETPVAVEFWSGSTRPITRLELQLDGRVIETYDLPAPLQAGRKTFSLSALGVAAGRHELGVQAIDALGDAGAAKIAINVQGPADTTESDRIPPVVSIYYPAQGAVVSGEVVIRAEATDNVGVRALAFRVDGKLHTWLMKRPPYEARWDTTKETDGPHVLEAAARDEARLEGRSASVTVIVQNNPPPPATLTGTPPPAGGLEPPPAPPSGETWPSPGATGARRPPIVTVPPRVPEGSTAESPGSETVALTPEPSGEIAVPEPTPPVPVDPLPPVAPRREPEVALAPGPSAGAPETVDSGQGNVLTPGGSAPAGANLGPSTPSTAVPGTDLSVAPEPPEPEVALISFSPTAPTRAVGAVRVPEHSSVLSVPSEGTVAKPEVEPPKPTLAPMDTEETPVPSSTSPGAPVVQPAEPEPASDVEGAAGHISKPAVRKMPLSPPDLSSLAMAAMSTPPEPKVDGPGARDLLAPEADLYREGPVTSLPDVTFEAAPAGPTGPAQPTAVRGTPQTAPAEPAPSVGEAHQPPDILISRGPAETLETGSSRTPTVSTSGNEGLRRIGTRQPGSEADAGTSPSGTGRVLGKVQAARWPGAPVVFDGKVLPEEAQVELRVGVLMISLKHIFEAADGALYWFPQEKSARAVTADADLAVWLDSSRAILNGKTRELASPVVIEAGRILVPIDLVAEALGVSFELDADSRQVIVKH